jgi:trimeric autotransporter adhesin
LPRIANNIPRLKLPWLTAAVVGAALAGCSAGRSGGGSPPPPPVITIKSISTYYPANPAISLPYAIAGQGSFTLLLNGVGFTATSAVEWNGNPLPTSYGDSTDLNASVSSALIAAPGTIKITVSDSSSGAVSNALSLPIASPATATAGVVALVSAAMDGSPGNGDSLVGPSISATGRYVVFQSASTNLAPGPASGYQEIYERDTCIGAPSGCSPNTIRITVTYDGSAVNGHSRDSAVSADGRYVAFDSSATNILPSSDACASSAGYSCVFLRDTCIGAPPGCTPATLPISVDARGNVAAGGGPQMTPDARFISFGSSSSVLGLGIGTTGDGFVRDTCIGASSGCLPSTTQTTFTDNGSDGNANSQLQVVAGSGSFTAFVSWATNMVPDTTVVPGVFRRVTCLEASGCSAETSRMDVAPAGNQPNQPASFGPFSAISGNGRLVAFGSTASNLVAANVNSNCTTAGGCADVYVRDTCEGAASGCNPSTSVISVSNDGSFGNCSSPSDGLAMTSDGRFVAFDSIATNLTPDDSFPACAREDVFVRDTCFGVTSGCSPSTVRVSVANTPNPALSGNAISGYPAISADGHYVVFISSATNLLPGVTGNGHAMVWLAKTGF